jgi:hypothetical protein
MPGTDKVDRQSGPPSAGAEYRDLTNNSSR